MWCSPGRHGDPVDFAYPLPVGVICEMLGVPRADRERFRDWTADLARILDAIASSTGPEVIERGMAARHALVDTSGSSSPSGVAGRGDLLSELIAAEEQDDRLSEGELMATILLLFVAGHETTVNLIGNGTLALLRHPEQLRRLRERSIPAAQRRRGAPPLRRTGAAHGPHLDRRRRAGWPDDFRGLDRLGDHRGRQPRSGDFRGSRPSRHRPSGQPAPGLRLGHPLLPGGFARPPGSPDRLRRPAATSASPRPRHRHAGMAARLSPARTHRTPSPSKWSS